MNTETIVTVLKALIAERAENIYRDEYTSPDNQEERELHTLGIVLAHYFKFDGDQILRVAMYGCEDANWHTEAGLIEDMLKANEAANEPDEPVPNPICPPKIVATIEPKIKTTFTCPDCGRVYYDEPAKCTSDDCPSNEPEEHPIMTAVLGSKPDPTAWYKKALENAAKEQPVKIAPNFSNPLPKSEPVMPAPQWGKNIIHVLGIKSKDYTRYGVKYEGSVNQDHNADIKKGEWIRLYGIEQGRAYDITFKIGDTCIYGSYNLYYTGKIVSIGEKTITIDPGEGYSKKHQLDLYTFNWRNYDYDAAKVFENNSTWTD